MSSPRRLPVSISDVTFKSNNQIDDQMEYDDDYNSDGYISLPYCKRRREISERLFIETERYLQRGGVLLDKYSIGETEESAAPQLPQFRSTCDIEDRLSVIEEVQHVALGKLKTIEKICSVSNNNIETDNLRRKELQQQQQLSGVLRGIVAVVEQLDQQVEEQQQFVNSQKGINSVDR